jgi:hypothetical protein
MTTAPPLSASGQLIQMTPTDGVSTACNTLLLDASWLILCCLVCTWTLRNPGRLEGCGGLPAGGHLISAAAGGYAVCVGSAQLDAGSP